MKVVKESALILQKKEASSQRFIALEKRNLMGSNLTEMMESFLLQ